MQKLIKLCSNPYDTATWHNESKTAFEELFGAQTGRYSKNARDTVKFRTPKLDGDKNVPFSAIINPSAPDSGGYSGMSFVIFPVKDGPPMLAMVVGTMGLSPDEHILGKPGHSRKVNAIAKWLNNEFRDKDKEKPIAWAKQEALRIDKAVPKNVQDNYPNYYSIFAKYGKEIYGFCEGHPNVLEQALKVFLDLHFEERNCLPLAAWQKEHAELKSKYFDFLMPKTNENEVLDLLKARRFVILQGPPGTGKTRLSQILLKDHYHGNGTTIQFHPNTTYETFIGGLFPETSGNKQVGLSFALKKGSLLEAVEAANNNASQNYLLVIDEINRADLAKVLGETIFCLEPYEDREVGLNYEYEGIGPKLSLPKNLHILGTMNTADRSIAILDVAIRRRFAFVDLWPENSVVENLGTSRSLALYQKLLSVFVEYANEDSMALVPGHSYFLDYDGMDQVVYLKTNLLPLLKEYMANGYVASFADHIHALIQEIEAY
jgi:5-methylcytosine-specific restriction enzyme B